MYQLLHELTETLDASDIAPLAFNLQGCDPIRHKLHCPLQCQRKADPLGVAHLAGFVAPTWQALELGRLQQGAHPREEGFSHAHAARLAAPDVWVADDNCSGAVPDRGGDEKDEIDVEVGVVESVDSLCDGRPDPADSNAQGNRPVGFVLRELADRAERLGRDVGVVPSLAIVHPHESRGAYL